MLGKEGAGDLIDGFGGFGQFLVDGIKFFAEVLFDVFLREEFLVGPLSVFLVGVGDGFDSLRSLSSWRSSLFLRLSLDSGLAWRASCSFLSAWNLPS